MPPFFLEVKMTCTSKFFVRNPKTGEPIQVPCGYCMACRIAKTREWTVRLIHELSCWDKSSFVTLTYDDEHMPADGSIHKIELQNFFKRLRKDVNSIKYYACGEYGDITNRPHYHAIIFGVNYDENELINENWKKGFIQTGTVTADSCQYVCGYIRKKLNGDYAKVAYGPREIPFALQSKGLGKNYLLRNLQQIEDQKKCTVHGKNYGLPLYYKRQLSEDTTEELRQIAIDEERSEEEELLKRLDEEEIEIVPDYYKPLHKLRFKDDLKNRILDLKRKTLEAQVKLYQSKKV